MSQKQLNEMENRLDADYAGCFPSAKGWERVAAHLLLAYDFTVRTAGTRVIDKMKYALMHTLRWGSTAPSCEFCGYPHQLDTSLFESCRALLSRGAEYTGICGAFISHYQGLVDVSHIDENEVEFTQNPSWKAYDVLDERLAFRERQPSIQLVQNLRRIAAGLVAGMNFGQPDELMHWFPDFGTTRKLLSPVSKLLAKGLNLPQSWAFDGISLLRMRAFWRALLILGLIHCAVAYRLTGNAHTSFVQLLVKRKDDLADWIAASVGIEKEVALRLLDLHTYNRFHHVPDIAVTPFLPITNAIVAASPWMLVSSSFERNFCAHAARQHSKAYDDASGVLAPHLAKSLVTTFTAAGFQATHSIKLGGNQGDIDLFVWSPSERYVMASELKWVIATADFMEVLNRGERRCKDAMQGQVPKCARVLSIGADRLVAKAFQLGRNPTVDEWACGMIVRGFVGSPRIPSEHHFLLPEPLAKERLCEGTSLRDLCDWAKSKAYLPIEGRDFRMYQVDVTSPSGILVKFWERHSE